MGNDGVPPIGTHPTPTPSAGRCATLCWGTPKREKKGLPAEDTKQANPVLADVLDEKFTESRQQRPEQR